MEKKGSCSFCPVPWSHAFVATDGSFLSCAVAASAETKGLVLATDGTVMRAGETTIEQYRNAPIMKELRLNMLKGEETPSVCARCIEEDRFDLLSWRKLKNAEGHIGIEEARALTSSDGTVTTSPSAYNLRLGNHCNLACRTCGPSQSSAWYEEWLDTHHRGFKFGGNRYALQRQADGRVDVENSPFKWSASPEFWRELEGHIDGVKEFHFSGGEPFLSTQHMDFIQTLVDRGLSAQVHLDYSSNLNVLPARLLRIWPHFKKVSISASIDGVGALNDYVRHRSNFRKIEENLKILDTTTGNIEYWASTTVSSFNVAGIPDLVRWILGSGLAKMNRRLGSDDPNILFSYHLLRAPREQCIMALPPAAKALVRRRFEGFLSEYPGITRANEMLSSILNFMDSEDRNELGDKFNVESEKMDSYRGQRFAQIDPEMAQLLLPPPPTPEFSKEVSYIAL